ncbi:MAG: glycosyltransferase family 1 protein [Anaerolineales bacterium]|nr:glycosyltransferase family 1 protein [Anaerolineales bacterium]
MKILIATIGSRGDVQPYINLAQGLLAAGHDVRLASNPTLASLAETHRIPFHPVGRPVDMGAEGARLLEKSFDNMWIGLIRVMQLGARLVEAAYPEVLAACREADLVVTSDTGSGVAEAEKLGKPRISVTLQPARVPVVQQQARGAVGRAIGWLLGKMIVGPTNRFRKRVGAPLVQDISSMLSQRMILLPVSPSVAPFNPQWTRQVRQTGYWFAREVEGWNPPQELLDFLAAGEKPVAVSLGVMSTSGRKARESAKMTLEAIQKTKTRAILQGWDQNLLESLGAPGTVYCAGSLPHNWLFDQVSAVIHHGGFGTTAAGLRSGAPSIVIPHIIDQYAWGQAVFDLGVGPKFISRGNLTSENLAAAISEALGNVSMRAKAAQVGSAIRS